MPVITTTDDRYNKQQTVLKNLAAINAGAAVLTTQRQWYVPDVVGLGSFTGYLFDIGHMQQAFDQSGLAASYNNAITSHLGTTSDCMASKLQADYLASQERCYRLRHSSSIRCALHSAARLNGHGNTNGVFGKITQHINELIASGSVGFPSAGYGPDFVAIPGCGQGSTKVLLTVTSLDCPGIDGLTLTAELTGSSWSGSGGNGSWTLNATIGAGIGGCTNYTLGTLAGTCPGGSFVIYPSNANPTVCDCGPPLYLAWARCLISSGAATCCNNATVTVTVNS